LPRTDGGTLTERDVRIPIVGALLLHELTWQRDVAHPSVHSNQAMSGSPGSGPITITFLTNSQWIVSQWTGMDESGVNRAGAIVQAASNRARRREHPDGYARAAGWRPQCRLRNCRGERQRTGPDARRRLHGNRRAVVRGVPAAVLETEWATDDNTVDATWTGSLNGGILGVELRTGGAP
jgi:hypothetical protein